MSSSYNINHPDERKPDDKLECDLTNWTNYNCFLVFQEHYPDDDDVLLVARYLNNGQIFVCASSNVLYSNARNEFYSHSLWYHLVIANDQMIL